MIVQQKRKRSWLPNIGLINDIDHHRFQTNLCNLEYV